MQCKNDAVSSHMRAYVSLRLREMYGTVIGEEHRSGDSRGGVVRGQCVLKIYVQALLMNSPPKSIIGSPHEANPS